ncbi:hypothetical protein MMC26_003028 [Xylographa opegraphella]|nr:hypothetical protein [Xylographa opegraphella]
MIEEGAHDLLDVLFLPPDHAQLLHQDDVVTLQADLLHPYAEEQVVEEVEGLLIVKKTERAYSLHLSQPIPTSSIKPPPTPEQLSFTTQTTFPFARKRLQTFR